MKILEKIHNKVNKFFDWLFSYKGEQPFTGGQFTNLDPAFYERERNYHEQAIMEINDEISELEEERSKHEYFYNISNTMYSKLIQKVN